MKRWSYKRGGASREGGNFVIFYYLSASEMWPAKVGDYCTTLDHWSSISLQKLKQWSKEEIKSR
jgi:hypothetical protein